MPNKRPRKNNARTAGRKTGTAVDADRAFSQTRKATAELTSRQAVRHAIATETAAARAVFFKAKKDYFLPLLPQTNFIQKLVDKPGLQNRREENQASTRGEALAHSDGTDGEIHPYADIEDQPKGITATMKPYQLAGLSFLIYLHKNGLSGILGDEMGLGKTLQTLSLFQHLKENDPPSPSRGERRPFLVVCPLSVLSSWMAEIARWAPQLKAIRLHGSLNERARLKRVAEGLEDRYGNQLETRARQKGRPKRTASVQTVVVVDSDSDQDVAEAKGIDIVVTTYETFLAEQSWFKRAFVWRYVVLDEGHKIKNDLSLVSVALHGLQAEFRLILTGYVSAVPDRRHDADGLAGPRFRTICWNCGPCCTGSTQRSLRPRRASCSGPPSI